jgi:hypothetical protein
MQELLGATPISYSAGMLVLTGSFGFGPYSGELS